MAPTRATCASSAGLCTCTTPPLRTVCLFVVLQITKRFDDMINVDFWTTLSREQQKDIELGIIEIARENTVDYEIFINKYRQ